MKALASLTRGDNTNILLLVSKLFKTVILTTLNCLKKRFFITLTKKTEDRRDGPYMVGTEQISDSFAFQISADLLSAQLLVNESHFRME